MSAGHDSIAGRPDRPRLSRLRHRRDVGQPQPEFRAGRARSSGRRSEPAPTPSSCRPTRPTRSRSTATCRVSASPKARSWSGQTLYKLYQEATRPGSGSRSSKQLADELGMHCFSSPFDPTAVDFLEAMDVPAYKVASFEIGRPAADREDGPNGQADHHVDRHGHAERDRRGGPGGPARPGRPDIALLKCTSAYPGPARGNEPADHPAPGRRPSACPPGSRTIRWGSPCPWRPWPWGPASSKST